MTAAFKTEILKISVAQICQTIGFQGICSTPLDVLVDLLHRYLTEVSRLTHRYTEHFGRSEPNLDDLGLCFHDMGISIAELEEFVNNVDCAPSPHVLPLFPVPRASNLNFLKPGAREILSRPIHVHEHLPPMFPEKEAEEDVDISMNGISEDIEVSSPRASSPQVSSSSSPRGSPQPALKRPSDSETSPNKKPKYSLEDEGQPVREIISVMMTTSGFISSGREGKLPEPRAPNIPIPTHRSTSPLSAASTANKKKLAVEKLIRQKNNQIGPPKLHPSKPRLIKDKSGVKLGSKMLKMPKIPKIPKLPPQVKPPPNPTPLPVQMMPSQGSNNNNNPTNSNNSNNNPPIAVPSPLPPKLKMPTPKLNVPKTPKPPKTDTKKTSTPKPKETNKGNETKKVKKEKEPAKKAKENKKEKEHNKKPKEGKKEKESKKEKEPKKEKESKKEKENKKEKERERERELIMALAASSAVTVTSIPAPAKPPEALPPEKAEGKSKLSIFKKINKGKGDAKDQERGGEREVLPSRDSSPDLMIDENPSRLGHRRPPEELTIIDTTPVRRLEQPPLDDMARSPGDFSTFNDELSPPGTPSTPRTPEIPHLPIRKTPEKRKGKEKAKEKRPRKDRSKSGKSGLSPAAREHSTSESETPDRPKTPEIGLPLENLGGAPPPPFSLPPFPNAPSFIPPFSRYPFIPPFGGPLPRPGLPLPPVPDLRLAPAAFLPRPAMKRPLDDDHLPSMDDPENLERPLTPRHDRDSSPLPPVTHGHASPMRSPSPPPSSVTPPRPRTPAHHSPPPPPLPVPKGRAEKAEKPDKEKKKEHKKEKKEKEKEKEKDKGKKKKDKKDKEKEKEKSDKKKGKVKAKQEKKEKKKVKKQKGEGGGSTPRASASKTPAASTSTAATRGSDTAPVVPTKVVIKPVMKRSEEPTSAAKASATMAGPRDDQPGSPEIAKFSALITRPPRGQQKKSTEPAAVVPVLKIKDVPNLPPGKGKEGTQNQGKSKEGGAQVQGKSKEVKEVPPLKIKNPTSTAITIPTSSKTTQEKKSPAGGGSKKSREKKEKKEKVAKESSRPSVMSPAMPGSGSGNLDLAMTSQVTAAAALPPPPMPDPPKPSKKQEQHNTGGGLLTETVGPIGHFVDDQGNEVWICPTCGKQDDGSPMIGCDTCDDWYHWVCVGIQVPPNDDVNWYCPRCLSQHKQRGVQPEKKKRGRKKK